MILFTFHNGFVCKEIQLMFKKGELFRRMVDERTAGLPSTGFLDAEILIFWDPM